MIFSDNLIVKELIKKDPRLSHAIKLAEILGEIMLFHYQTDYSYKYETSLHNENQQSFLELNDSPSALKLSIDLFCNNTAQSYLTSFYPHYGFIGEESYDSKEKNNEYYWCVDPICGSMGYKKKTGNFGTSIALVKKDYGPVVGVMYCPIKNYWGICIKDNPPFFYVPDNSIKVENSLCISSNQLKNPFLQSFLKEISIPNVFSVESLPVKSLSILSGIYSTVFGLPCSKGGGKLQVWDIAASVIFFKETGAIFTDCNNIPFSELLLQSDQYSEGYIMTFSKENHQRFLTENLF